MLIRSSRRRSLQIVCFLLLAWMLAAGQTKPAGQKDDAQKADGQKADGQKNTAHPAPARPLPGSEYSGMYSFLREGEFVQVTVEEQGRVTGFVSRFGDSENDRGDFLDHFFKSGKLDGNQIAFTTEIVHGVSFEFKGAIDRGDGKNPGDEAYYVLKGSLAEITTDDAKKTSSRSRDVALKSFPQDLAPAEKR